MLLLVTLGQNLVDNNWSTDSCVEFTPGEAIQNVG